MQEAGKRWDRAGAHNRMGEGICACGPWLGAHRMVFASCGVGLLPTAVTDCQGHTWMCLLLWNRELWLPVLATPFRPGLHVSVPSWASLTCSLPAVFLLLPSQKASSPSALPRLSSPASSSSPKGTVHPRLPLIFPPSFSLQSPTKLVDVTHLLFSWKTRLLTAAFLLSLSDLCLMMRCSPQLSAGSPEMPQNQPPFPLLPSILMALMRATNGGQNK